MNYLSHFYFEKGTLDPYQILGVALPDLYKGAERGKNIHPKPCPPEFQHLKKEWDGINKGWARHVLLDHVFHNEPYFEQNMAYLTDLLRKVPFENKYVKPHFISHVMLELILDGVILRKGEVDPQKFYDQLNRINPEIVASFLAAAGLKNTPRFLAFFEKFKEYKYVFSYEDSSKLYFALNRIFGRLWESDFEDNKMAIIGVIDQGFAHISKNYSQIYSIIDPHLNSNS
jgi:hypothetical protein